jgi:hypothetical protein
MDLNAVVSDPEANSYLTLEEADELMDGFLSAEQWDALRPESSETTGETIRIRLLRQAARLVDRYRPLPPKAVAAQALAWPTAKDPAGEIPRGVKLAVCEWIDAYLQGGQRFQALKRMQAEGVTSMSQLGQSSSFDSEGSMLPGGSRRELDRVIDSYDTIIVDGPGTCHPPIFE